MTIAFVINDTKAFLRDVPLRKSNSHQEMAIKIAELDVYWPKRVKRIQVTDDGKIRNRTIRVCVKFHKHNRFKYVQKLNESKTDTKKQVECLSRAM